MAGVKGPEGGTAPATGGGALGGIFVGSDGKDGNEAGIPGGIESLAAAGGAAGVFIGGRASGFIPGICIPPLGGTGPLGNEPDLFPPGGGWGGLSGPDGPGLSGVLSIFAKQPF